MAKLIRFSKFYSEILLFVEIDSMKILKSALVLIICLLSLTCSNFNNSQLEKKIEKPNSLPILEMSEEFTGLWDINGEVLDFRLYENGFIEYEILDNDKKVSGKINKTEDIKITRESQINENQVIEILNLLSSNEFLSLENSYKPKRSCIDNFISNTIHFQYKGTDKIIKVKGHCEDLAYPHSDSFPNFPALLSDLFKRIDKIKTQSAKKV